MMRIVNVDVDRALRDTAMRWLDEQSRVGNGLFRYETLSTFEFRGARIPLMDRQKGIRKPAGMETALSIRTVFTEPGRVPPYKDHEGRDGLLRYKYQGDDPEYFENVALRNVYQRDLPLIWFIGVDKGQYLPIYPVWIVADEPSQLQFVVALDAAQRLVGVGNLEIGMERGYVESITARRLHQPVFRSRVLSAYEFRCAMCRLQLPTLLDAAHILRDGHPNGVPIVPNGLSLCKIHHAAYDQNFVGIRPDLGIEVRPDFLVQQDGPMLLHGIQELDGTRLIVPRSKSAQPDADRLEERYEEFREAS